MGLRALYKPTGRFACIALITWWVYMHFTKKPTESVITPINEVYKILVSRWVFVYYTGQKVGLHAVILVKG